jgi:DMSO/TMAO reductase YedYZ heme-binding membrane subunit
MLTEGPPGQTGGVRFSRRAMTWTASGSVAIAPAIFVVWLIWSTGQTVHPIEVRLTIGPLACLLLAALAVSLATPLLMSRPPQVQAAFLGAVVGIGVCEVLAFGYIVLAVSLGIPAAP